MIRIFSDLKKHSSIWNEELRIKIEIIIWLFQPQNILLTDEFPKGSVKICDLGFACLVNTGEDIRDIIGTPDYVGMYLQSH